MDHYQIIIFWTECYEITITFLFLMKTQLLNSNQALNCLLL